ncbi:MAG: hypothetical protein JWM62_2107, partial [Frankiales bacterium]|nr:hypothetical protein [Frankiales bacterium]
AVADSKIMVRVEGQTLLTTVGADGGWSVTPTTLSLGTHSVMGYVTAAARTGTDSQLLTVAPAPALPRIAIAGGDAVTTLDATPLISGTSDAPAGSPIMVRVEGQTLLTTVGTDGGWAVLPATLSLGTHSVMGYVTDAAGTGTDSQLLTVAPVPALPTIVIAGGDAVTTLLATPLISGTSDAPAGSKIMVRVEGQTLLTTVGAGGGWAVTPTTLSLGTHSVMAYVTDAAGTGSDSQLLTVAAGPAAAAAPAVLGPAAPAALAATAPAVLVVAAPAPAAAPAAAPAVLVAPAAATPTITIAGGHAVTIYTTTPTITGTAVAVVGSPIVVTVDGQTLTTTLAADGTWSVRVAALRPNSTVFGGVSWTVGRAALRTHAAPASLGQYPVTATVTDANGSAADTTVLRLAPRASTGAAAPTITTPGGATATTANPMPTLAGTETIAGTTSTGPVPVLASTVPAPSLPRTGFDLGLARTGLLTLLAGALVLALGARRSRRTT